MNGIDGARGEQIRLARVADTSPVGKSGADLAFLAAQRESGNVGANPTLDGTRQQQVRNANTAYPPA